MTTALEIQAARPTTRASSRKQIGQGETPLPAWAVWIVRAAFVAVALWLWETASDRGWWDNQLFGEPTGIWTGLREYITSDRAHEAFRSTGFAVLLSFVIGSVAGTVAGLMLGLSPTLNAIVGPFLAPLNSVPRIALAPLFIAWFGLTSTAKIVLAVSIVFFILAENARSAVRSVDADLMMMSRVVGLSRLQLVWKVILPSAVPTFFAGLRLTFTYSLLGVVASEMIAATSGVGQDIVFFSSSYQINTTFGILGILMVFAVLMNWVFDRLEYRLLRWQRT